MSAERVRVTRRGDVEELRLVRGAGNAIDAAMVAALADAVERLEASDARAVLISAAGPAFTVGGDLHHFGGALDRLGEELGAMIESYHATLARLARFPQPVVCAVGGAAAGGGLGLLWCSDFVVMADDGVIATGFAKLGLSGDGGSSWFLPRLVGVQRARELLLAGRVLTAAEALEWGLVGRVVARADLEREAESLARELAAGPTATYGEIKRLLAGASAKPLEQGLADELAASVRSGASADAREGVAAFVDRREPRFAGS